MSDGWVEEEGDDATDAARADDVCKGAMLGAWPSYMLWREGGY